MAALNPLLLLAALFSIAASAQQALEAPGLVPGAQFGAALAGSASCTGSGVESVAVGAPHGTPDAPGPGAVVRFNGAALGSTEWTYLRTVASPTGLDGDRFGASLDVNFCEFTGWLVGAPGAGQAFHYRGSLSGSGERTRLDGASAGTGSEFGHSVSGTGGSLVVGAPGAAAGAGRVLTFPEYGTGPGPAVVAPQQTLTPSHTADRRFGASLDASDGDTVLPGGFNRRRLYVGAPDGVAGAVYVFVMTGQPSTVTWTEVARIVGPPGFGTALSSNGRLLAVSSPQTNEVYVYEESPAGTWTNSQILAAPPSVPTGQFGADGVALLPAGGAAYHIIASAPSAPHGPVAFLSSDMSPQTLPFYAASPSPNYGMVASWSVNTFRFAVGDPAAGGTGAAWTGDASLLPVASEPPPSQTALAVRAVPLPAHQTVTLRVMTAEPARLLVADALGRTVWQGAAAGSADLVLDTSHWATGVYLVRMDTDHERATGRIVIAR